MRHAKLSPDGKKVGYVLDNNIYVQDLETGKIKQITNDGSDVIINGQFDWVYEEEFGEPITLSAGIENAGYEWIVRLVNNGLVLTTSDGNAAKAVGAAGLSFLRCASEVYRLPYAVGGSGQPVRKGRSIGGQGGRRRTFCRLRRGGGLLL